MRLEAKRHANRPKRIRVGARVRVSLSGRLLPAMVIEDRGNLGLHGQQVVRLAVRDPNLPEGHFQIEVPADWVQLSPAKRRSKT